TINLVAGVEGVATLRFSAAGEMRELTVVVGTPPPGSVPLVVSTPVGVELLPVPHVGRVYSALGGQPSLDVPLLGTPATADTVVSVTSSDVNVAAVSGAVVIPVGGRSAA